MHIKCAPISNKYLVDLLRKIDRLDGQKVVLGFENVSFDIHENKERGLIELWTRGSGPKGEIIPTNIKLCRVVF